MSAIGYFETEEARAEQEGVRAGRLPERYAEPWGNAFFTRVQTALRPGAQILDVGSGARPTIGTDFRPDGCRYVGLDIAPEELHRAPPGSYDELVVGDISAPLPELAGRFDLVVSWQVLEHVPSMAAALATLHDCLVPGGRLVAHLSGSRAIYAIAARALPHRFRTLVMQRLLGADPEDKFPTRYDACTDVALARLLSERWSSYEIVARYKAGGYLRFSRSLQRAYLVYENWVARHDRRALATHYIVDALR